MGGDEATGFLFFEEEADMPEKMILKHETCTAILVDGGFYRKRANYLWGPKEPKARADELREYCYRHLRTHNEERFLYRVFFYDCPPIAKNIHDPVSRKTIDLSKTPEYAWMTAFLKELKHQRKFALRLGAINESQIYYQLNADSTKKLMSGALTKDNIDLSNMDLHMEQKGVDVRIAVDIISLAFKKQVNQIILISGDSDFVPAAKQARREGIDFLLDPMRAPVKEDLYEHIDGIVSPSFTPKGGS